MKNQYIDSIASLYEIMERMLKTLYSSVLLDKNESVFKCMNSGVREFYKVVHIGDEYSQNYGNIGEILCLADKSIKDNMLNKLTLSLFVKNQVTGDRLIEKISALTGYSLVDSLNISLIVANSKQANAFSFHNNLKFNDINFSSRNSQRM